MLFLGWQGIYTFVGVCLVVGLVIMYFSNRLNQKLSESETALFNH